MSAILRHILTIGWHRLLLVFLLVWLVIIVFTAFPMIGTHLSAIDVRTSEKLSKALADLEALRKQNLELQEIFKDINAESVKGDQKEAIENFQQRLTKVEHEYSNNNKLDYINPKEEPNSEYEQLRRRIFTNTQEFWYFMRSGLLELQKKVEDLSPDVGKSIQYMLDLGGEHKRSLLHDIEQLTEVDGYASWREKEANDLSELVQKRFHYLQNPSNCETAKKLICSLNKACGYGCQMHHMAYCFIVAYALNRTVIMRSRGWVYHKNGWEDVFHPVSRTCLNFTLNRVTMNSDEPDVPIIRISNIDDVLEKPSYFPPAVPQDLAPRLIRLHNNPTAWWLGQVLKYFLKPTSKVKQRLEKEERRMGFTKPIVGVHVRRTDKKREAEYYTIEEYMVAVEEYYKQLQLKQTVMVKRIYLATDEPAVINETKEKYPEYEVLSDVGVSKSARRYSGSLFGILKDIYFLSKCDFLVCTFSSQVSRLAFEIMQTYHVDASAWFKSHDNMYFYGGGSPNYMEVLLAHKARDKSEISLEPGEEIEMYGNHWNGFSKGRKLANNEVGLFPGMKVKDIVETALLPVYVVPNSSLKDYN